MKRFFVLFLLVFNLMLNVQGAFASQTPEGYKLCQSRNLLSKTQDWLNEWKNVGFDGKKFQYLQEGSTITLSFRPSSKGYSYHFWDSQWRDQKFSNVEETPESIIITLTKKEAAFLSIRGFIFGGSGFRLSSIKYTYFKPNSSLDSLESSRRMAGFYASEADLSLPILNVTTKNGREPSTKGLYQSAVVDLFNQGENQQVFDQQSKIKVRGNSTVQPDDKPYRIKFNEKQNLLGLNGGKKFRDWVLLKSQYDLASDYFGFKLSQLIFEGEYYASDCAFVHLMINGNYKGVYLLCEQNQVGKNRVDIAKCDSKDPRTGYLLELDNYPDEKNHPYFTLNQNETFRLTDINNQTRTLVEDAYTIKSNVLSSNQSTFIKNYLRGVWKICYEALVHKNYLAFDSDYNLVPSESDDPRKVCSAVVDLDSLVNSMLIDELVRDNDVGAGSFFLAVDFTKSPGEKYSRLTFEAPWDFNWAYSESKGDYAFDYGLHYYAGAFQPLVLKDNVDRSNFWYTLFNTQDWFRKMVRDKWEKISRARLENLVDEVESYIKSINNECTGKWPQHIFDFIRPRIAYIDDKLFL